MGPEYNNIQKPSPDYNDKYADVFMPDKLYNNQYAAAASESFEREIAKLRGEQAQVTVKR